MTESNEEARRRWREAQGLDPDGPTEPKAEPSAEEMLIAMEAGDAVAKSEYTLTTPDGEQGTILIPPSEDELVAELMEELGDDAA